ncbi:MAG TPA: formate dehydrogenase accessory protein FdhE [Steroidobacteraceae bacterium]|nr:formate dehydrogenase accessory protein FdhE [Steroidobacteraceae bacterium]
MRQGELVGQGKWTGTPGPGVGAPLPLILPDPLRRFSATAARLARIAPGQPAEGWLRFVEQLSRAQHQAAADAGPCSAPDGTAVRGAVDQRLPPLAPPAFVLEPAWQGHLGQIAAHLRAAALPEEARAVLEGLAQRTAQDTDRLAHSFLEGDVASDELGPAVFVAAALQVHFTRIAGSLQAQELRLLPRRGLCPCCGSTPVAGVVTAAGPTPGTRYLHCSLCSTAWNHVRAVCIRCGEAGKLSLRAIEDHSGFARAERCANCQTYSKLFYERDAPGLDPVADDLGTLALDVLMGEDGWQRHAPNPLFLIAG